MKKQGVNVVCGILSLCLSACGDDGGGGSEEADLEIVGAWESPFGMEVITETAWNDAAIVEFSNRENLALTQNAEDAAYDPAKYNRIVWTEPGSDSFYYCTEAFGLGSVSDAQEVPETPADPDDLDGAGCGGFSWTELTRVTR